MDGIQALFGTVLWVVTGCSLVVAICLLVRSGRQWEDYGRNHLLMERDTPPSLADVAGSPAAIRERDDEVREFLDARNARRARRGVAPVDVEAELRRLTTPLIDAGIRGEIRDLVIARNYRRARAGKPCLDVEAEIEREIAQLGPDATAGSTPGEIAREIAQLGPDATAGSTPGEIEREIAQLGPDATAGSTPGEIEREIAD